MRAWGRGYRLDTNMGKWKDEKYREEHRSHLAQGDKITFTRAGVPELRKSIKQQEEKEILTFKEQE